MRDALVVRGGWDGHVPEAATDLFVPFLRDNGFTVEIHASLDVYADADRMAAADLVVQCWSMTPGGPGGIAQKQVEGLDAAVRAGTGFAGWHGGVVASFHDQAYQRLTGGVFVHHPRGFVDHEVSVAPDAADHPVVAGLPWPVRVHTEKYWVLTDPLDDVLATVTFAPDAAVHRAVKVPAVWTRRWGAGRVFVSTVGHKLDDLTEPTVRSMTGRGLLWAARGSLADKP